MMSFWKNLDELSEWDGYKLSLQQEYDVAPEDYPVNPADCNAILEMDDASLGKFMGGLAPLKNGIVLRLLQKLIQHLARVVHQLR